ncbi:hypothetical protein ACS0TY_034267 [Phlomoides rotata]
MEAVSISLFGTIIVTQPVSPISCSKAQRTQYLPISLTDSPFTFSPRYNSLAVLGCKASVWLRANETTTLGGCTALCGASATTCSGVNCCQTTIPPRLKELQYTYKSTEASSHGSCGYVFPVDKKWLKNLEHSEIRFVPLVLEWEFGELKGLSSDICMFSDDYCLTYPDDYGRRKFKEDSRFYDQIDCARNYRDSEFDPLFVFSTGVNILYGGNEYYRHSNYYGSKYAYVSSTKYCSRPRGFEGNPYLPKGCTDIYIYIYECSNKTLHQCPPELPTCANFPAWRSRKRIAKVIKARHKCKFFKRNGGLLLEQQLSAADSGIQKIKLFSSKELTKATDRYNENRVLGRGGQGTVYKGMLTDGRIVPLLVYEFIPNGTLYQHIHDSNDEFPLTWELRVRIAREVAGALAYLHSASSAPIYHRDIKSTNILLDDKYRAKVADFGTSRSVSIDQTHLTTKVVGTFGYLDPEYFRSGQFTEKSDVYSFGVVMVELLTGEKAVSSIRAEEGKGLATHFLCSMEESRLFEILDARVLEEGKAEEVLAMEELSRRCLHLNGKRRPTMKDVAHELEAIRDGSNCVQNQDDSIEHNFFDFAEFDDISSLSGTLDMILSSCILKLHCLMSHEEFSFNLFIFRKQ